MKKSRYLIIMGALLALGAGIFAMNDGGRVKATVPGGIVPDGTYVLQSLHSGKVVDSTLSGTPGAQLLQWGFGGGSQQRWQLEHLGSNQYKITSVFNGRVMDVAENSLADGGRIVTWTWSGAGNQKFVIESRGYSSYAIRSLSSGKYLDVLGPSLANGALIGQYSGNNQENQTFVFLKQD